MKRLIIALGLVMMLTMAGCDSGSRQQMDYTLTITIDNTMHHDSATLLVLEDAYNQLRNCGTVAGRQGTFVFTGQTDRPKAAIIRWDNDSVNPFYFVLEGGDIHLDIKPSSWAVTGSALNAEYLRYVNQRNAITDARVATWQEYLKMSADSSLSQDDEHHMVVRDSLLNDSVQRITVERINQGDAVGRVIRERYGSQLDKEHMKMLR